MLKIVGLSRLCVFLLFLLGLCWGKAQSTFSLSPKKFFSQLERSERYKRAKHLHSKKVAALHPLLRCRGSLGLKSWCVVVSKSLQFNARTWGRLCDVMCKLDQVGSLILGGWANSSSQVVGLINIDLQADEFIVLSTEVFMFVWHMGLWMAYADLVACRVALELTCVLTFIPILATWQLCIDQPHDPWSEYAQKPTRSCVLKGTDMLADMCVDICIQKVLADASTCWPEPALGHTDAHMKDLANLWIHVWRSI